MARSSDATMQKPYKPSNSVALDIEPKLNNVAA
jgi:hypothetical protein